MRWPGGTGPAAAVAAVRGEGLRVVLRIDTPALAGLPWEAMFDQAAGTYVCRQDQLVRHVPVASVPAPLRVRPPLRILGVVSSPRGLPVLDVDKEQDQLARALARPASQGLAELHWAPSATWADLQDLLLDGEWHVLHFIGHGDFDPGRDEGVLALTREDGRADLVAAHRLTDLLRQARPMLRLVVLNSCSGAAAGASDLFSGTAAALVRGGVSAVAAMQYEISDPAAVAFARGFYAAIARGRGVDDAVSSGRVAILGLSDRTLEWVTPVLYLRGHDTRLFTFQAPPEDTNREGTQKGDTGASRGGRRGDTISPGAAGGPGGDSPAGRPGARAPQPSPTTPASLTSTTRQPDQRAATRAKAASRSFIPSRGPGRKSRGHHAPTSPTELARLSHGDRVSAVVFSPDGARLVTGSGDGTARVWDLASGEQLAGLSHGGRVSAVAFSPDGARLVTGSGGEGEGGGTARVWDLASGEQLAGLSPGGRVMAVAFSPDGARLATGSGDRTARVWDLASGEQLAGLSPRGRVMAVAFSPDGARLATGSGDGTARVWDLASGEQLAGLSHGGWVMGVAFSPDGARLATGSGDPTGSGDHTARVWDLASGEHLRTLTGYHGAVMGVAFSPDGARLATGSGDGTARVWDLASGEQLAGLSHGGRVVLAVAFSPDGARLATGGDDHMARIWAL